MNTDQGLYLSYHSSTSRKKTWECMRYFAAAMEETGDWRKLTRRSDQENSSFKKQCLWLFLTDNGHFLIPATGSQLLMLFLYFILVDLSQKRLDT